MQVLYALHEWRRDYTKYRTFFFPSLQPNHPPEKAEILLAATRLGLLGCPMTMVKVADDPNVFADASTRRHHAVSYTVCRGTIFLPPKFPSFAIYIRLRRTIEWELKASCRRCNVGRIPTNGIPTNGTDCVFDRFTLFFSLNASRACMTRPLSPSNGVTVLDTMRHWEHEPLDDDGSRLMWL